MEPPEQLKNSVIVAHEVIEQILTQSSELIYQNYIYNKSKPFALNSILNIIISAVEINYLRYDTTESTL